MRELAQRINALSLGETSARAIALVGTPFEDYRIGPDKGPGDWKWHFLQYWVMKADVMSANTHDKYVELVFDRQDKLIAIESNNVAAIANRGSVAGSKPPAP